MIIIFVLIGVLAGGYLFQQSSSPVHNWRAKNQEVNKLKLIPERAIDPEVLASAVAAYDEQYIEIENAWQKKLLLVFQDEWNYDQEKWDSYVQLREKYQEMKMDFYEDLADKLEEEGSLDDRPLENLLLEDKNFLQFEDDFRAQLKALIGENNIKSYEKLRESFNIEWGQKTPGEGPMILIDF